MHYCGVVPVQGELQLAMLEEVRAPEPPIRLNALFYEPGDAEAGGRRAAHAERRGRRGRRAARRAPRRSAGARLRRAAAAARGRAAGRRIRSVRALADLLRDLPRYAPDGGRAHRAGRGGQLQALPAVRDQRRRRLLRAPGPPAGRQAPSARRLRRGSTSSSATTSSTTAATSGIAASRRSTPPPARSAPTATRSGTRAGSGIPPRASMVLPGAAIPAQFSRQGVMPAVERLHLSRA